MDKKIVLLIMGRKVLSDALTQQAKDNLSFEIQATHNYSKAAETAINLRPDIVVLEVPESGPWGYAEKCLIICDDIKAQLLECRQILLCAENDKRSVRESIKAKRQNRIDDFLYYDTSIYYLFSKLESLS